MILLQAAMAMGFILLVGLGLFLAIGTPLLVTLFMKLYRKVYRKNGILNNDLPYYKEPLPFFVSIVIAVFILIVAYYWLTMLFFYFNPDILEYS